MSFSSDVKDELARQQYKARHCLLAELAAVFMLEGFVLNDSKIIIKTEHSQVAKRCFSLIKQGFDIRPCLNIKKGTHLSSYEISMEDETDCRRFLEGLHVYDNAENKAVYRLLIQNECCKRAYLRGAFLCAGSMSDPEKFYHFEIVCDTMEKACQICEVIKSLSVEAKTLMRKGQNVVYVKDGSDIADLLNIMGAHVSLMNMENVRILKDMRNQVNRRVNCETANLEKTVSAALRQIEDIEYLRSTGILNTLDAPLRETAELRQRFPEASLKELGEMSDPPVGRSGINHRLRRLSEIAKKQRL